MDVLIIGGGASGLFLSTLLKGRSLLLEKNQDVGMKLLLTGGGKCNYTHDSTPDEMSRHYYDASPFVRKCLYSFPPEQIKAYFKTLGIEPSAREDGKVFPKHGDANTVREALLNVSGKIKTSERVTNIKKDGDIFTVRTEKSEYKARYVVISSGGCSYPRTGSNGDSYRLLKALGHTMTPLSPALSPLNVRNLDTKPLMGISLKNARIRHGKKAYSGALVFTGKGISGPMANNMSREIQDGDEITLSFANITAEEIKALPGKQKAINAISTYLSIPSRLVSYLLKDSDKNIASLSKADVNLILRNITSLPLTVDKKGLWNEAMSTRGGVKRDEINPATFESKLVPNLYILGEAVDVDAECGGYSLSFAFASAYSCFLSISKNRDPN